MVAAGGGGRDQTALAYAAGLPRALAVLLLTGIRPRHRADPAIVAYHAATDCGGAPWRTAAFLSPAVSGLAALALSARLRPGRPDHDRQPRSGLLAIGLTLALLPPGFLRGPGRLRQPGLAKVPALRTAPGRPQSTPALIPRSTFRPSKAAAAGLGCGDRRRTRALSPPGATARYAAVAGRLPGPCSEWPFFPAAILLFRLVGARYTWAGSAPSHPEGFLEVAVDGPVHNLQVRRIQPTVWERAGWVISVATATGLMLLLLGKRLVLRRRVIAIHAQRTPDQAAMMTRMKAPLARSNVGARTND